MNAAARSGVAIVRHMSAGCRPEVAERVGDGLIDHRGAEEPLEVRRRGREERVVEAHDRLGGGPQVAGQAAAEPLVVGDVALDGFREDSALREPRFAPWPPTGSLATYASPTATTNLPGATSQYGLRTVGTIAPCRTSSGSVTLNAARSTRA